MSKLTKKTIRAELETAAVCGLFCPSCSLYIGTVEEPRRLEKLAEQFEMPIEDMRCTGCRTDNMSFYCKTCKMKKCSAEHNIQFCSQCGEYPCPELEAFQKEAPHRAELWSSLEQIRTEGWRKWFMDMLELNACPGCGTINSAYDAVCRECGGSPASRFTEKHEALITSHRGKLEKG